MLQTKKGKTGKKNVGEGCNHPPPPKKKKKKKNHVRL